MDDISENTLVLAPLTPSGSRGYLERLAEACAPTDCLAAISYTQSPDAWAANWNDVVGPLPDRNVFFYGGMQESEEESSFDSVVTVDPTDPMSIITGVEERLNDWQETEGRPVVSLQTLSVLLEYVDFDTTFRYLYLLVQKIEAANAVGYFQIDPHLHSAEEINTLRSLFDSVVEFSDGSWEASPSRTVSTAEATPGAATTAGPESEQNGGWRSVYDAWRSKITALLSPEESTETDADAESEASESASVEETPDVTLTEEELLTDEERIRRFLQLSGGRARQADMTDAFSWSASTVSRKLSKMEAADQISRVKIGRENVVFLEDSEPEAVKSPFDTDKEESDSATEFGQ